MKKVIRKDLAILYNALPDEELIEEQVGPFSQSVELARRCG